MAREIRAPKEIADELHAGALIEHAWEVAAIVSMYTHHTQAHVMECVMRVVGHLCATGGDADA